MTTRFPVSAACLLATLLVAPLAAQQAQAPDGPEAQPEGHRGLGARADGGHARGATGDAAPSDAIVLFGGQHLDEWVNVKGGGPAGWTVADGVFTVNKPVGNIQTKRSFTNYQLHLEWRVPANITGKDQGRGNSGLFLASTGGGDSGYELQILDSYNNRTYANGQAGSIYKQAIPLANAMRKPGEWNVYDVVWTAPTFNADGSREDAGARHGAPQRRADPERPRAEGRDAVHRQADLQGARRHAHQAAGARRSQRAPQLPQHLDSRTEVDRRDGCPTSAGARHVSAHRRASARRHVRGVGIALFVLAALALITPLATESAMGRVGLLLLVAGLLEVYDGFRRARDADARAAWFNGASTLLIGVVVLNSTTLVAEAFVLLLGGWFLLDALRYGLARHRRRVARHATPLAAAGVAPAACSAIWPSRSGSSCCASVCCR